MTLAIGNVTSGVSETDATSYVTGTAALTADRLNLLFVCARGAGSAAPTVTQTGVTWTLVRNQASGTITRMSVFSAKVSSNQSGTITIDFGSNTQSYCLWSVANFYDDVLGSAAVVQSASASSSGPDTSMTVTLAAFGSANNMAYGGFYQYQDDNDMTVGSGFTGLHAVASTNPARHETEHKLNDTTVDMTFASSNGEIAIALEIEAAAPPVSTTISGVVATASAAALAAVITAVGTVSIAGAVATASAAVLAGSVQIARTISAEVALADAATLPATVSAVRIVTVSGVVAEATAAVLEGVITAVHPISGFGNLAALSTGLHQRDGGLAPAGTGLARPSFGLVPPEGRPR